MSNPIPGETSNAETARALIACLDYTNLDETCTEAEVETLCEDAATPQGNVAAICIWPRFVEFARTRLSPGIRIATVVNFPGGSADPEETFEETVAAIAAGADEIDMVIDHRRLRSETGHVERQVRRVKDAAASITLKAILETGALRDAALIERAAAEALAGGADFLKTSTGKTAVGATPEAARILLGAIAGAGRPVGFKPSGGIRSFEDARAYRDLARSVCGADFAVPATFRLGASSVLADLLAVAQSGARAAGSATPAAKVAY